WRLKIYLSGALESCKESVKESEGLPGSYAVMAGASNRPIHACIRDATRWMREPSPRMAARPRMTTLVLSSARAAHLLDLVEGERAGADFEHRRVVVEVDAVHRALHFGRDRRHLAVGILGDDGNLVVAVGHGLAGAAAAVPAEVLRAGRDGAGLAIDHL